LYPVGFETMTTTLKRTKTVAAVDRVATSIRIRETELVEAERNA
jgi:hypothetical protein